MIGMSKTDMLCCCQCCNKKEKVMDIKILNPLGQGAEIHLCKECRMELAKLIVTYEADPSSLLHINKVDK